MKNSAGYFIIFLLYLCRGRYSIIGTDEAKIPYGIGARNLGNGDGTFQPYLSSTVGTLPQGIATGRRQ
jgi:hypothetical protein